MKHRKHLLNYIYFLLVMGVLCGCDLISNYQNVVSESVVQQEKTSLEEYTEENKVEQTEADSEKITETSQANEQPSYATTEEGTQAEDIVEDRIDTTIQRMTLREKVGQMFIVRPDALDIKFEQDRVIDPSAAGVKELTDYMVETLKDYPVGGIIFFDKNIQSPEQITMFNESLRNATEIPMFLSVDEEGGVVSRIENHPAFDVTEYKNAATVGATKDTNNAFQMGQTIGAYLKEYGFNMDFAPVADVYTNPQNVVIGARSFSSDAQEVAKMSGAMAQGLCEKGIIPVFKHFPGHGDTAEDSHKGLAVSYKTKEELENCEWIPFKEVPDTDCIMMGHIAVPNVTGEKIPASLSYAVVTEILREEMGFQGLIITDSFEMKAIINTYTPGEASVAAILAGNDMILSPNGLPEAFETVIAAVEEGTIEEERIDESVRRILRFKYEWLEE